MPTAATRTSTSRDEILGRGTSRTSSRATSTSTLAFIVFAPGDIDFLSLLTYDPHAKVYRNWYFDAGGAMPRGSMNGTWDEKSRTMTWSGTDEDGNKTVGKTKIIDKDTHEWTVVVTNPAGKVVLDLSAKNTRRKE